MSCIAVVGVCRLLFYLTLGALALRASQQPFPVKDHTVDFVFSRCTAWGPGQVCKSSLAVCK